MGQVEQAGCSTDSGAWAVNHARDVIEAVAHDRDPPAIESVEPPLDRDRGAFVTIRRSERLRGCMGRPRATQPGVDALRVAAVEAATQDPRFSPLAPEELDAITVEVSILSQPEQIPDVSPSVVSVGRDGLIVSRGERSGLLLPQVPVEQGWDAERFLAETSRKAGLAGGAWRETATTVSRFEAAVFREAEPSGPIERVDQGVEVSGP
jgi:AmmeMemoRadiSam system protein A